MKLRIVSLNTWGGRALHPLLHFFKRYRDKVDIFCLQEVHAGGDQAEMERRHPDEHVRADAFIKIARELPGFAGYFAPFSDDGHRMSLAMFVRYDKWVDHHGHELLHQPKQPLEQGSIILSPRKVQSVVIRTDQHCAAIVNYHGLWTPDGKGDTPERLEQSWSVQRYLDRLVMPKILLGDLNLEPYTDSLKILEECMDNLVKKYGIQSTRTVLYRKHGDPAASMFADYALVSPDIGVHRFEVLSDICSDHAPLYLECELR